MSRNTSPALVYAVALVLAACSLLYELLIAQALSIFSANTVVWYSVTIGIYLAAMGMGALFHDRYATENLWARLFRVELGLSVVGALAIPALNFAHTSALVLDMNDLAQAGNVLFYGSAFLLTAIIGVLTGFELPLLIDLGNSASGDKRITNRVLASDYMGSLVGGLAFPLVLLPSFSMLLIGLLTAAINFAVAALSLYWFLPSSRRPARRLATTAAISGVLVLGLAFSGTIDRYFVKNYYFYFNYWNDLPTLFGTMQNADDVFRERSLYQRIDLVFDEEGYDTDSVIDAYSTKFTDNPAQPRNYVLFLNGDYQLASSYEEFYHEYFAHVPIITNGEVPKKVLVMGAGDGLLIRELIKYPGIESILHVDLDNRLVELAREHPTFLAMNESALEDPRVTTVFDDAFRFIRNSDESYDAIFLDFPYVTDYNLSKLFSREFYHFVHARMAEGGFVALDTPGLANRNSMREIYTATISAGGFNFVRPYTSRIETYNPNAAAILRREGMRSGEIGDLLEEHAESLEYGYVIARDELPDRDLYFDPDVKLHALNEERLMRTLRMARAPRDELDKSKVNSIFRPTLPRGSIWGIRSAW